MNNDDLPRTVFAICGLIMILLAALVYVIFGGVR